MPAGFRCLKSGVFYSKEVLFWHDSVGVGKPGREARREELFSLRALDRPLCSRDDYSMNHRGWSILLVSDCSGKLGPCRSVTFLVVLCHARARKGSVADGVSGATWSSYSFYFVHMSSSTSAVFAVLHACIMLCAVEGKKEVVIRL